MEATMTVSRELPINVEKMLSNATNKHKKLSIAFAKINGQITALESNKQTHTFPSFLKNLSPPECRLTAFAADIQTACNSEITAAHKQYMSDCLDKIISARKEELESTRTAILGIENELTEETDTYLERVKDVQLQMSMHTLDTQRKVNAENTKIKTTLIKEFKNITTANIRKIGIEKTNTTLDREKIRAQREHAGDTINIEDTGETIERLINKKFKSLLSSKQLTSTSKTSKFNSQYNKPEFPKKKKNVNTKHFNNTPHNTGFKHKQTTHKQGNTNAFAVQKNNHGAQKKYNKYQQNNTEEQQQQMFEQYQQFLRYQQQHQTHQQHVQHTKNAYPQGGQQRTHRPPPSGGIRDEDRSKESSTRRRSSTPRLRPRKPGNQSAPYLKH
jgi:hypothetical protein